MVAGFIFMGTHSVNFPWKPFSCSVLFNHAESLCAFSFSKSDLQDAMDQGQQGRQILFKSSISRRIPQRETDSFHAFSQQLSHQRKNDRWWLCPTVASTFRWRPWDLSWREDGLLTVLSPSWNLLLFRLHENPFISQGNKMRQASR